MKNKLKLLLILMTSMLFFTSCEKEEFEVSAQASPTQTAHQVRKISFGELKRNRSAFETLKESCSKLKASSLLHRGVYSDDFGVFIDTTTILVTEKDGKHSITFRILNEEEVFKIKNLVLNAKEDGSYKAYITEYILSQAELTKLANNEPIGEKYPSAVTDVSTYSRFSIEGDGAGCVEVRTYTVRYCNNSSGQTIVNTGTNGGNSSDCYDGYYEEEYQVMIIDAGCLSGGGGGNNPGGDIPGYNPGDGSGNSGGGSSSGGNTGNPDQGNNGNPTDPNQDINDGYTPIITTPILTIDKREVRLYNHLNTSQQAWWNNAPVETKNALLDYFNQNSPNNVVTDEAMTFILELIDIARTEVNQEDAANLVSISLLIENSGDNLFTEEFEATLIQYTDLYQVYPPHDYPLMALTLKTYMNYKQLRVLNPEWSRARCIAFASKDILHLGLDVFGLVPVVGEPADLINGLLYTIEGDNLNATLSYASAVPVLGWATTTTKFGLKVVNVANDVNTKIKLVWKVGTNGFIEFGSSSQLRKVLNLTSSSFQAHHIIPWAHRTHPAVQKAAKSGNAFHMNEALNGIPLSTAIHSGSHPSYSNLVKQRLDNINLNQGLDDIYDEVIDIINDVRIAIQNNPNVPINQLIF